MTLDEQFDANERDAIALVDGLSEEQGTWRRDAGSWSVSECVDHLATADRVYLRALEEPVAEAHAKGVLRRGAIEPGIIGAMFVRSLEPPPRWWSRLKAPGKIRPRTAPPLGEAFAAFLDAHRAAHAFLLANEDLDLAAIRFRNPFIRGIRFSLATGLHVIVAHERRHLWQAWNVRRACLGA